MVVSRSQLLCVFGRTLTSFVDAKTRTRKVVVIVHDSFDAFLEGGSPEIDEKSQWHF